MNDVKHPTGETAGPSSNDDKAASAELLAYLAAMAGDLHVMARKGGLTVIAALLNLVRVEAELSAGDQRKRRRAN